MTILTKDKRVIEFGGKRLSLGDLWLTEWIKPECYAVSNDAINKIIAKVTQLSKDSPSEFSNALQNIGYGNLLVKTAWSIVNTQIRYRYDSDLFNVVDFWMLPFECWKIGFGDCEDTAILLTSIVERLFSIVGEFQRETVKPECYIVIGYVSQAGNWYGHGYVLYRDTAYPLTAEWQVFETTMESEVSWNFFLRWYPDFYLPVYWFNSRQAWRIDRDYMQLNLSKDYVDRYSSLINSMIAYVETATPTPQKWVHKTVRPVKAKI